MAGAGQKCDMVPRVDIGAVWLSEALDGGSDHTTVHVYMNGA